MKKMYGEQIAECLSRHDVTQAMVARALEVSTQTVWSWVNNHTSISISKLVELADYLGCTTDELLGRKGYETGYVQRVYEALNEEGRQSLEQQAQMHYMNPRFLPEDRAGKVRA